MSKIISQSHERISDEPTGLCLNERGRGRGYWVEAESESEGAEKRNRKPKMRPYTEVPLLRGNVGHVYYPVRRNILKLVLFAESLKSYFDWSK